MVIKFNVQNIHKGQAISFECRNGIITKIISTNKEHELNLLFVGMKVDKFVKDNLDVDFLKVNCQQIVDINKRFVENRTEILKILGNDSKIIRKRLTYLICENKLLLKQVGIIKKIIKNQCNISI